MITMYACRYCCGLKPARHELENRHLRGRILHGHSVRLEFEVGITPDVGATVRVRQ